MGFLPVPPLNPRHPSTAFKVRGSALRVDLLTPAQRSNQTAPVLIPRLNAAAQPLWHLDYLIERPERAAVVDGGGILVNVPSPARFALHKLLTARARPVTSQAKVDKDLSQAGEMLALLAGERPDDLVLEWEWLAPHAALQKGVRAGLSLLGRRQPDLVRQLARLLGT
jgi:hypothetical protein